MPFLPPLCRVGEGRAFGLVQNVIKIQHLDNSTDVNVPAPWIQFLCHNPFQGRYVPPTGGGGHITDDYTLFIWSVRAMALNGDSAELRGQIYSTGIVNFILRMHAHTPRLWRYV